MNNQRLNNVKSVAVNVLEIGEVYMAAKWSTICLNISVMFWQGMNEQIDWDELCIVTSLVCFSFVFWEQAQHLYLNCCYAQQFAMPLTYKSAYMWVENTFLAVNFFDKQIWIIKQHGKLKGLWTLNEKDEFGAA